MGYQKERDDFLVRASAEGLSLEACRKLLRYASTLQRLAEAQCNGDWPYNGDRDRPSPDKLSCTYSDGLEICGDECTQCKGSGWTYHENGTREKHDKRYTTCPKCEASGVAKSAMRYAHVQVPGYSPDEQRTAGREGQVPKICPDCRTQELVNIALTEYCKKCNGTTCKATDSACDHAKGKHGAYSEPCECFNSRKYKAIFNGDPRGAVLRLATPNHPWSDDGSKGNGLYVPSRSC